MQDCITAVELDVSPTGVHSSGALDPEITCAGATAFGHELVDGDLISIVVASDEPFDLGDGFEIDERSTLDEVAKVFLDPVHSVDFAVRG